MHWELPRLLQKPLPLPPPQDKLWLATQHVIDDLHIVKGVAKIYPLLCWKSSTEIGWKIIFGAKIISRHQGVVYFWDSQYKFSKRDFFKKMNFHEREKHEKFPL